jgi:hypothetical protein
MFWDQNVTWEWECFWWNVNEKLLRLSTTNPLSLTWECCGIKMSLGNENVFLMKCRLKDTNTKRNKIHTQRMIVGVEVLTPHKALMLLFWTSKPAMIWWYIIISDPPIHTHLGACWFQSGHCSRCAQAFRVCPSCTSATKHAETLMVDCGKSLLACLPAKNVHTTFQLSLYSYPIAS